jgi:hypothetical protein
MSFPILDSDLLERLPKARKTGDMRRILEAPTSEDYVTWNVFALLKRIPAERWWPAFVELARAENKAVPERLYHEAALGPELWNLISSPDAYESASRLRVMQSEDEIWRRRAENRRPVEGSSEIDVAIETDKSLVFIEAKLGADVSLRTTYDPTRNQIARNIDCLLKRAQERNRKPFFWMVAKDRSPNRKYVQLLAEYRENPDRLSQLLEHRSEEDIDLVCRNSVIILWRDFVHRITEMLRDSQRNVEEVVVEIQERIETQMS